MPAPGDVLSLRVDKPAAGGRMIARADRLVVLVSGAIPGELVRARIERVGKGVAYATVVDVEEASPDRRTPYGDPLCGGCLYSHIAYQRQLALKSLVIADAFARIGRLDLPGAIRVAPSAEEGYRMRARLQVRSRGVGFFREGTHDLCDARSTRQLLPASFDAVDRLIAAMQSAALAGVTEIELAENLDASQRVVHLTSVAPFDGQVLGRIGATEGLTGLSTQSGVYGDAHVTDVIAIEGRDAVMLRRHVLAFFQGNRYLLGELVAHVLAHVEPGGEVVDLYAGVGLFAVTAALTRGARVTAVEGDRRAAADLTANSAAAGGKVVPIRQSVEEFVDRRPPRADTLIVDPPRTGMSREALEGICRMECGRIIFVACDVATLARDARRLADGGYRLTNVEALDLFPNTPHVETVAVFDRG
jgi:23S rRNA (uracil1939-C5)-methyltransferase